MAGGVSLVEPSVVAVDRKRGLVFVGDVGAGVVDVYDSSGHFVTAFGEGLLFATGVAVDEASGFVYVTNSFDNAVLSFKRSGSAFELAAEWEGDVLPGEGFGEPTGVAVDNSGGPSAGDVYVVDAEDTVSRMGVVDVFKPTSEGQEGTLVSTLSKGNLEEPNGIAVDPSSGRVYVADSAKGMVYEYSAGGALEGKISGAGAPQGSFRGKEAEEGNVSGVAVDPSSGDLLVAEGERGIVSEFNSEGTWVGWLLSTTEAPLAEPHGVALDGSGSLWVADSLLGRVDEYGPALTVPSVATEKAYKATRTSLTLNGTVNGEGATGDYFVQWGTSPSLGASTSPQALPPAQQSVSVSLEELTAGTTYYFRVVAEDANGRSYGVLREATTAPAVEKLSTGPISDLAPESATLSGSLAPNGFDTHYYFEWGLTPAYGNITPELPGVDAGSAKGAVVAGTALRGLTPNTTYHYRLVATNSFGIAVGGDRSFTTSGPPRLTNKAVTAVGHETATLNAEISPSELDTTYRFEYGETPAYGTETPVGGADIGAGSSSVPVSATLTGLKLGVTYHYRLVATNSFKTTTGPDETFTTVPPALVTAFTNGVKPTEATLNAEINPLGNDTTYYFQYGTTPCASEPSRCTSLPTPPGEDIGTGEAPVTESIPLVGLEPDSTYYYRVVALNTLGEAATVERSFTTQKPVESFALPDGRAWELVTPPDKEGAPVEALTREGGIILASVNGERLTFVADGALGEGAAGNRSPEWQQILATRGADSWTSQDIATPNSTAKGVTAGLSPEYQFFTSDLTAALVEPTELGTKAEPPLAPGVVQATPYIRDNISGAYTPLVTEANTAPGTAFGSRVSFASGSQDLTHVVLSSAVPLSGSGSAAGLYEWSAGSLHFVSVLPTGTPAQGTVALGFFGRVTTHAVSEDGTRVIWSTREENTGRGHLYLRDTARNETVQIDAAHGTAEPPSFLPGSARYQAASPDDSTILFTDKQQLTADSTAEPGQNLGRPDLYMCQIVEVAGKLTCDLTDLTVDANEGEHAAVQGFLLGADPASGIAYFVAQGVLATNANGVGAHAVSGDPNLYEIQFDATGHETTFIATLASDDTPEWEAGGAQSANLAFLTARISENGRFLAFMSSAPLTGYDNVDVSSAAHGARDEEVFLYDSSASALRCVSCNPTGERPAGVLDTAQSDEGLGLLIDRRKVWGESGHEHWVAGNIPGWTAQTLTSAVFDPRYLTNEGRLFFNSPDQLVPADSNGKNDVYEFEPSGVGSCESATGGCVALISAGTSPAESAFIEATPNGEDAFFVTQSRLLPQDTDTALDIYDARVCSAASPCLTLPPPAPGPCDETETCRPASPIAEVPVAGGGSNAFRGPSNPVERAAPSGGVKGSQVSKPAAKSLTRKQKLVKMLKQCRKIKATRKRHVCEAKARRLYGPHHVSHSAQTGRRNGATRSRP